MQLIPLDQQTCARRLRFLVATHLVLAAAPLMGLAIPLNTTFLPILWAIGSLSLGSMMTFTVWIGLGKNHLRWRLLAGVAGSCYLAMWPFMATIVRMTPRPSVSDLAWRFVWVEGAEMAVAVAVLGGVFLLIGHWFELQRNGSVASSERACRFQFSVLHLLLLMLFASVVLMFLNAARIDLTNGKSSNWQLLAAILLVSIVFLTNAVCAVFCTLRPGAIQVYIGLVLIVAFNLAYVLAFAANDEKDRPWTFVGRIVAYVIPTVVVLASLLVVRSCGYRLIRQADTT